LAAGLGFSEARLSTTPAAPVARAVIEMSVMLHWLQSPLHYGAGTSLGANPVIKEARSS